MYYTILALPFLSALTTGLLGRKLGVTGARIIACTCLISAAILSVVAFYEVAICNSPVYFFLSNWIDSEILSVHWAFWFDSLTVSMLIAVLVVSSLVHLYSASYIENDPHQIRFFSYLSIFTFFMVILVTGDNLLVMFVGWEGIGVSSFLLISFWYTRLEANNSALQALITNRVGDMFLTVGFFIVFWLCGSLDYATIANLAPHINEGVLSLIALCFILGAIAKSSQIGLHAWLPSAMEGPTPVSALIHAATLVTAGIYLLMRSSPLLEYAPTSLLLITFLGALTAFYAASIGIVTSDLKRTIAFSTMSQIGYLFMAVGLSQYSVAIIHLVAHAYFKALLFIAAGGVLHSLSDMQDIRGLGGLIRILPFTYTAILIGSLTLMAIPFISGFYSKDLIIELGFGSYSLKGFVVFFIGTITAIFTAFYSFRLISLTFFNTAFAPKTDYENTHEQPLLIIIPLVLLSFLSIFFGYFAKDMFVGIGSDILSSSLFTHPKSISLIEAEFSIPTMYKLLPAILTFSGAGFSIYLFNKLNLHNLSFSKLKLLLFRFFNNKYNYDGLLNHYVVLSSLNLGLLTSKVLDRGTIEIIGPNGLTNTLFGTSKLIGKLDSGVVTDYSLYLTIAIMCILVLLFIPILFVGEISNMRLVFLFISGLFFIANYIEIESDKESI